MNLLKMSTMALAIAAISTSAFSAEAEDPKVDTPSTGFSDATDPVDFSGASAPVSQTPGATTATTATDASAAGAFDELGSTPAPDPAQGPAPRADISSTFGATTNTNASGVNAFSTPGSTPAPAPAPAAPASSNGAAGRGDGSGAGSGGGAAAAEADRTAAVSAVKASLPLLASENDDKNLKLTFGGESFGVDLSKYRSLSAVVRAVTTSAFKAFVTASSASAEQKALALSQFPAALEETLKEVPSLKRSEWQGYLDTFHPSSMISSLIK